MARFALVLIAAAAVFASSASASTQRPSSSYVLPQQMEASIQEYGLTWAHRNHAVLTATCDGQGLRGPKRRDEWGFQSATYHLFLCMVSVRNVPDLDMVHVETRPGGHWAWEEVS